MRNDPELLKLMINDEQYQKTIYRPGPYWIGYQKRSLAAIAQYGVEDFRSRPAVSKGFADARVIDVADTWILDTHRATIKYFIAHLPIIRSIIKDYVRHARVREEESRKYISDSFKLNFGPWFEKAISQFDFPDTLHGGCDYYIEFDGNRHSLLYIYHLMRILNYSRYIEFESIDSVLEIGGGFGTNAHLLLHMYPNINKFVYIDIPPMIYIATQYLKNFFGKDVVDYRQTRKIEQIRFGDEAKREIFCLCPWQIENLQLKAKLFWNASSLSEMTPDIVDNYAGYVRDCLDQESSICLVMNKRKPRAMTTIPDRIKEAFGSDFVFEDFDPEVENERPPLYTIGRQRR